MQTETARIAGRFFAKSLKEPTNLQRLDRIRLQSLLALHNGETDLLSFLEALEALALDRAEMHEHVFAVLPADEAESLGVVEPLHCTVFAASHCITPNHGSLRCRIGAGPILDGHRRRLVGDRKRYESTARTRILFASRRPR